jgi:metal-responsive CopG/Arc/MetJ family transcriptional regulator
MAKVFGLTKAQTNKRRISIRMPKGMLEDIDFVLQKTNQSLRNRSKWISIAIINMSTTSNFDYMVSEEWLSPGNNESVQVTLTPEAELALSKMQEILINKENINSELISSIVRASIIQHIIKEEITIMGVRTPDTNKQ